MARRPAWLPGGGGGGIFLFLVLLIIVAALVVWARSRHPPGRSHPAATGVPPTLPARTAPTRR
ncbi:MAG TPA: hypothetical protein VFW19_00485 [Allosphingosinicella sp.]|nr:hypothetical protein [Allosphingosinicella sp.]